MHGKPIRLEAGVTADPGKTIERVEFYRYGIFIGEGTRRSDGKWVLETKATVPVFGALDESNSILMDDEKNNGGFENWSGSMPLNWFKGSAGYTYRNRNTGFSRYIEYLPVERVSSGAHSGNSCVKITGVPDATSPDGSYTMRNWNNVWFGNHIGMSEGNLYKIEFYARRLNGSAGDRLEVGAGYNNRFNGELTYNRTDGGWQKYSLLVSTVEAEVGTSDKLVFTSRKRGTSWLIDSVKVQLDEERSDIYQLHAVDSIGSSVWSDYAGIKTIPFELKVNFQSGNQGVPSGFHSDAGEVYKQTDDGYSYGWSRKSAGEWLTDPGSNGAQQQEALTFRQQDRTLPPKWDAAVPNGEYAITLHLPPDSDPTYSLMLEGQFLLDGSEYDQGPQGGKVETQVVVNDGRLTLEAQNPLDRNALSAIEITQISADEPFHTYRRGHAETNDYKSTVIGLDGQQGLRRLALSAYRTGNPVPLHYSRNGNGYSIPASGPIVGFGSESGAAPLLTDVSYNFGVSAGDVFQARQGLFPEEVASGMSLGQRHDMQGFYLAVHKRDTGAFIERIPLELPQKDTTQWAALLEAGLKKQYVFPEYGFTTWIKIQPSQEWNYRGSFEYETVPNFILTHMADVSSLDYIFTLEAVSTLPTEERHPAVQYMEAPYADLPTVNQLYTLSFDRKQPWRTQTFALSHHGKLLPSIYNGTRITNQSVSQEALDRLNLHYMNASGTRGATADLLSASGRAVFKEKFLELDRAPEFKRHPVLDQLVADYGADPLALARFVFNEIEVTDYIGVHPGLTTTDIPVEVQLGGLRRDALAVLQERQGSPREICILLAYLLRACGVSAAIAECTNSKVYLLEWDFSRLIGRELAETQLTPKKIPLKYPWVVAYLEGEPQPIQHLFPWMKETEIKEGHDLYDFMPERLNNGYKYFEKFIRADEEVMMIGEDGLVNPDIRGYDDDQPSVLWPALIKKLLRENGKGIAYDEVGLRKINRPQFYTRWADFPKPLEILGEALLHVNYLNDPNAYDTIQFFIARDDGNEATIDLANKKLLETAPIPLMDLHNRSVNIDYSNNRITLSIAPYLPYGGSINYSTAAYPALTDSDYSERAKGGFEYSVHCADPYADFAFKEHRQRAYNRSFQAQSTRKVKYYGEQNFWNTANRSSDPDKGTGLNLESGGIFQMDAYPIRPGNLAFCYHYGRVTTEMLERHTRDLLKYQQIYKETSTEDPTVTRHRFFTLMGQVYWQKTQTFRQLVANKHKFILPFSGGALTTGMYSDPQGRLTYPGINVFSVFTNAYWGGHHQPSFGWDLHSARWDPLHVGHIQGSSYEHAILRNFLGAEGAYSTVRILQEASRRHRANPRQVPDLVVLTRAPNARNKTWQQEGNVYYQGRALKDWRAGQWDKVAALFENSSIAPFQLAYMPPGPVEIAGKKRIGVATVMYYGGAGMYISTGSDTLNGGGSNPVPDYSDDLFHESDGSQLMGFLGQIINGNADLSSAFQHPAYNKVDPDTGQLKFQLPGADITVTPEKQFLPDFFNNSNDFMDSVYNLYILSAKATDSASNLKNKLVAATESALEASDSKPERYSENGKLQVGKESTSYHSGVGELVGDPVNVIGGQFYIDTCDLRLAGPFPLEIRRNYSSANLADNNMGVGWKFAFAHYLQAKAEGDDPTAIFYAAEMDGSVLAYRRESPGTDRWVVDPQLNPQLKNHRESGIGGTANLYSNRIHKSGNDYTLTASDGSARLYRLQSFPLAGVVSRERPYLVSWQDAHRNRLSFSYRGDPADFGYGNLSRIDSSNGNALLFHYDSDHRVAEIASSDGRSVRYQYTHDGNLTQVTLPDRSRIRYYYQSKPAGEDSEKSTYLLTRVEKPLGRILENDYDAERRVIRQRSTVGPDNALVENAVYTYDHDASGGNGLSGHTLVTAVNGGVTRYDYTDGQITKITDAENNTVEQSWYTSRLTFPLPDGTPAADRSLSQTTVSSLAADAPGGFRRSLKYRKDKRGLVTYFWYDAHGNLVQTRAIGELDGDPTNGDESARTTSRYNGNHLPLETTDPIGNRTRFEYNDPDYPYAVTAIEQLDANQQTIRRTEKTYSEVVSAGAAAYGLNTETRLAVGTGDESLTRTRFSARGFTTGITRYTDEDDPANATSDPNLTLDLSYDNRGLLIETIDPDGAKTVYRHDAMGRPTATLVYDAAGNLMSTTAKHYNAAGDLEWIDGPRSGVEDYTYMQYDAAGRLKSRLVWRSRAKSDGSGIEAFETNSDAAYAVTQFEYDAFGNRLATIDPRGHEQRFTYDKTGRKLTEAAYRGRYQPNSKALSQRSYTYEPGGKVATETNPLGGVTRYFYTDTGLLRRQENPDGTVTQFRYQPDGRLKQKILPSGNRLHYTYHDLNRRVTQNLRDPAGATLSTTAQTYDRRGNPTHRTDAEGYSHTTSYDDLDRPTQRSGPPAAGPDSAAQTTTLSYNPAARTNTLTDAAGNTTTTTTDPLGRTLSVIVRGSDAAIARETYFDYSTDQHRVTRTEGRGTHAIRTTTWTDTGGRTVLVQRHRGEGAYDFERSVFDPAGNPVAHFDALRHETRQSFDAMGRLSARTTPDGALTRFEYNALGLETARIMPRGLTHERSYDSAGRLTGEKLTNPEQPDTYGTAPASRRFQYEYAASGPETGKLLRKRHLDDDFIETFAYDTFLRIKSRDLGGNQQLQPVRLDYQYDKLGRITRLRQSVGEPADAIPPITTTRDYDGYGQIRSEQILEGGTLRSSIAQSWDNRGLRSGIRSARRAGLQPVNTTFGPGYAPDFTHDPAGSLASVHHAGDATPAYSADYLSNGRLRSAGAFGIRRAHSYDSRGRLRTRQLTDLSTAQTLLTENLTRTPRGKIQDYTATRAGRSSSRAHHYSYAASGRLTGEIFDREASGDATTAAYRYDEEGLGLLLARHFTGAGPKRWNALAFDPFARLLQSSTASGAPAPAASYTARGTAGTAEGLRARHNGEPVALSIIPRSSGEGVDWSAQLQLEPGSQLLEVQIRNPRIPHEYHPVEKRHFSVVSPGDPVQRDRYDPAGRLTERSFPDGRRESLAYDALGRLHTVTRRDSSGNGFDWTATYDGFGRRLGVSHTPVTGHHPQAAQTRTVRSLYDPQHEFLEIALKVNTDATTWKIHGNDLNGSYGGLHGIGGLISIYENDISSGVYLLDGVLGNTVASANDDAGVLNWHDRDYTAYRQLGDPPQAIESGGPVAAAHAWRGYRTDATGLIHMGARYYLPETARFISPDPLGHSASADLYSFANGDPVNFVDPTGRGAVRGNPSTGVNPLGPIFGDFFNPFLDAAGALLNFANDGMGAALNVLSGGRFFGTHTERFSQSATAMAAGTANDFLQLSNDAQGALFGLGQGDLTGLGNLVNNFFGYQKGDSASLTNGKFVLAVTPFRVAKYIPSAKGVSSSFSGAANKIDDVSVKWPKNRGFVAGEGGRASVLPGQTLDRFGGNHGSFMSPSGTPASARSLTPGTELKPLNSFEVLKPVSYTHLPLPTTPYV